MESVPFKFDRKQRQTLAARLCKFPDDLVQSFLNRCEYAITEWRADWPENKRLIGQGDGASLLALSEAILNVRCEINKLPDGASCALWSMWQHERGEDITKLLAAKNAYLHNLLELEQLAGREADNITRAGGVAKRCESDLVDRLVQTYLDASFGRKPSAAPAGIFMRFLGELENMLTLPTCKKLTLGKDIVNASIEWHVQREAQLQSWEAGMYELSAKKDS